MDTPVAQPAPSGSPDGPAVVEMPRTEWDARSRAHAAKVRPLTTAWLERRQRGEKHPVWDFLFTYYSFPPKRLLTWVPGVFPLRPQSSEAGGERPDAGGDDVIRWEVPPVPGRVRGLARWIRELSAAMEGRPPRFHCYGLHEWAMVYGQPEAEIRHQGWALRLDAAGVARVVESQPLGCTHYDAFRFFTPAARPRNQMIPTRESRCDLEQSGCLHANMDLYKWAYKLWPWGGSDLVADAFVLAARGRALDMRSSPYDLRGLGFEPIPIETDAGRGWFRREQQALSEAAEPIRRRVQEAANRLAVSTDGAGRAREAANEPE